MPELLIELRSEEIPARMQAAAATQLERLVLDALKQEGLKVGTSQSFVTPRRLALVVEDVPAATDDVREERKGPRVGAPDKAMDGFLRSTGLSVDQLQTKEDSKGEYYVAILERKGRPTVEVIAEIVPAVIAGFHWPKSMRWGAGTLRWVRPLQNVLCVFGGKAVPFAVSTGDGELIANDETVGHRFLAPGKIRVESFEDYREKLARAHVVLDTEERKDRIVLELERLSGLEGLSRVEDGALLEEVAGLVEDPVVLIGRIDKEFLDVPPEVLITAMRTHQKYFSFRDMSTAEFAPRFGVVANLRAEDGGKKIVAGNERVLRARLSDARFFWDQDRKDTLESRVGALEGITFHDKLGTMAERVERIERLARVIAPLVGANEEDAARAAKLCKADLTSGMVGEFPELQGVMGRYYALKDGEKPEVADAIRDHYRPQGPNDEVPTAPISIAAALADKIDTLVFFWWAAERPTGSRDPFALRRGALGIIRLILENGLSISLTALFGDHIWKVVDRWDNYERSIVLIGAKTPVTADDGVPEEYIGQPGVPFEHVVPDSLEDLRLQDDYDQIVFCDWDFHGDSGIDIEGTFEQRSAGPFVDPFEAMSSLLSFIADRLKVYLRDRGARHDLVDAVFSLPGQDDLVLIVKRVEALSKFLATEDGKSLLVAHDRAANILRIEEKKDKASYDEAPDSRLLKQEEEQALYEAITLLEKEVGPLIEAADFEGAMAALARLRTPVDHFFDKVTVNDKDKDLRANRLKLLSLIRRAMGRIADFSKISGGA